VVVALNFLEGISAAEKSLVYSLPRGIKHDLPGLALCFLPSPDTVSIERDLLLYETKSCMTWDGTILLSFLHIHSLNLAIIRNLLHSVVQMSLGVLLPMPSSTYLIFCLLKWSVIVGIVL